MKKYTLYILFMLIAVAMSVIIITNLFEQESDTPDESFTVTLSVHCDALLGNMHLLDADLHEFVPDSGIIFPATIVTAHEGDSVFDILQRELRNAGIPMVSSSLPGYNLRFVESINNISSFDAGPMSGWQYHINGESTLVGASQYIVSPEDIIEWSFTLDFSEDW